MRIKVDDTVQIIAGADAFDNLRGKVIKVYPEKGKILVEGAAKVYKHVKPSQKNPKGGKLSKEMPIDISNVMLVCTSCNEPSRTGARLNEDGSKVRFCKKCGADQGEIRPPKN